MRLDFVFKVTEDGKLVVKNTGEGYSNYRFVVLGPGAKYEEESQSGSGEGYEESQSGSGEGYEESQSGSGEGYEESQSGSGEGYEESQSGSG